MSQPLKILRFPDPFLRTKGQPVQHISASHKELARAMLRLMYEEQGVGLSAVQVGKALSLLTADTRANFDSPYYQPPEVSEASAALSNDHEDSASSSDDNDEKPARYSRGHLSYELESQVAQPLILFNPEIVEKKGKTLFQEGCLSFPSYYAEVERAEIVAVKALDISGSEVFFRTDGLLSICLQHEVDHLHGKLFIDHLSAERARSLRSKIKKYGYPESSSSDSPSSAKAAP